MFRLGPHVMCASTLDVAGIIEPVRVTPLPFTPDYMLGSFLFRDQVAAAISLRKKLDVRIGEDSAKGPFVVAQIAAELAAFWVDEVKDVLEAKDASWQPMPEGLGEGVFDRYTIRDDELILHTSFSALLGAGPVGAFPRWSGSAAGAKLRIEDSPSAKENGAPARVAEMPQPVLGRAPDDAETEAGTRKLRDAASRVPAPESARDEQSSGLSVADSAAGSAPAAEEIPAPAAMLDSEIGRAPDTPAAVAASSAASISEDAASDSSPRETEEPGRGADGSGSGAADEAAIESELEIARPDLRPIERFDLEAQTAAAEFEPAHAGDSAGEPSATIAAPREEESAGSGEQPRQEGSHAEEENARADEHARAPKRFPTQSRSEITDAPILDQAPEEAQGAVAQAAPSHRTRGRRRLAASALAAVLAAIIILWWGTGSDVPREPISSVPQPPAAGEPAAAASAGALQPGTDATPGAPATASGAISRADPPPPEPAPETTRIVTVKTEAFTMTVDRPRARSDESQSPAGASPGKTPVPPAPGRAASQPALGVLVHVVVRGDTLWDIARKHLGNPYRYPELVKLSGIRNPNLIYPGDIVRIEMTGKRP